ncbi:MAG: methyltransferase domain-containing protein [Acidobacteria bacterium]|nr:MAG: methyltransferase domain-containing protein [Acidobacteriota bacterium]
MVESVDWDRARAVVEAGPGTGAITGEILTRLRQGTLFFAVELHPGLGEICRRHYPQVTLVQDSIENLSRLCRQQGVEQVDCVISGLPWASFSAERQWDLLDAIVSVLPPGGQFVTFAYLQGVILPAARRFHALLKDRFSEVSRSRVTWTNVPPAFVYRCRR